MENDWKPELYLQFKNERIQPSIDLVNRIKINFNPENILDIGCGPGNSGQILVQRWPFSKLTGVDSSSSMIEKAKKDYPNQEWILSDIKDYCPKIKYDIIFSNAALQWISDHSELLKKMFAMLSDRGLIAVQVPLFYDMHAGKAIKNTGKDMRWKSLTQNVEDHFTMHDCSFYYNEIASLFNFVEIWQTNYFHIMDSHLSILQMLRSTGLKPYMERLETDEDRENFEQTVLLSIKKDYPPQANGKVLFPFNRLFFIGYK